MISAQYYLNRKDSLQNKVSELLEKFETKYKTKPKKILVNFEQLSENTTIFNLPIEPSQNIGPNSFRFIFPDDYAFAGEEG